MSSNHKSGNDADANFSFGVRELRQAKAAQGLSLTVAAQKTQGDKQGCDPLQHVRQLRPQEELGARRPSASRAGLRLSA